MSTHWSDEDLINKLYGIGREDSHLSECAACGARWNAIEARRQELTVEPEISASFLAAQRRQIHERLEDRSGFGWHLPFAPAMAVMCVVVLGVMLSGPAPSPPPTTMATNGLSDSEFYTEIYSLVENPEPWAAEPVCGNHIVNC